MFVLTANVLIPPKPFDYSEGLAAFRFFLNNNHSSPRHDTVDPMLLPLGNPIKCHEEVLSLQPVILPKRFDIFFPLTGGCRRSTY